MTKSSKTTSCSPSTAPAKPVRLRPRRPCPLCSQPSQQKYHPFCSNRCAEIDLHRWLGGRYAIPVETAPDFENPYAASTIANQDRDED